MLGKILNAGTSFVYIFTLPIGKGDNRKFVFHFTRPGILLQLGNSQVHSNTFRNADKVDMLIIILMKRGTKPTCSLIMMTMSEWPGGQMNNV